MILAADRELDPLTYRLGHPRITDAQDRRFGFVQRCVGAPHRRGRRSQIGKTVPHGQPGVAQQPAQRLAANERHAELIVLDLAVHRAGSPFAATERGVGKQLDDESVAVRTRLRVCAHWLRHASDLQGHVNIEQFDRVQERRALSDVAAVGQAAWQRQFG